jgi:ribonuclease HII
MICGVDEAGKGSVLGPMVVAAVGAESDETFAGLDVRDSKALSPKARRLLFASISERCDVAIVILPPEKIDTFRLTSSMNRCVARAHAAVIKEIDPPLAYVDACDVNPARYAAMVKNYLETDCEIISKHHADETYTVVSAASIVAKVIRDSEIEKLSETFGRIGSGYSSDPETIAFLLSYINKNRRPPPFARKSWKTVKRMLAALEQKTLD